VQAVTCRQRSIPNSWRGTGHCGYRRYGFADLLHKPAIAHSWSWSDAAQGGAAILEVSGRAKPLIV
ncbi:MAG: hypothetical protein AAF950_18095, partial [Pseudomonadota bacterium]